MTTAPKRKHIPQHRQPATASPGEASRRRPDIRPQHFLGLKDSTLVPTANLLQIKDTVIDTVESKAMSVIYGDPGLGKSFSTRATIQEMNPDLILPLDFARSRPGPKDLREELFHQMRLNCKMPGTATAFDKLLREALPRRPYVIVCDEAQQYRRENFEFLRKLWDNCDPQPAIVFVGGREAYETLQPMWRTRWAVPDPEYGENPLPPLLFVFNRLGARNPDTVIPALEKLTWRHWAGHERHQHFSYDQKLPIVTVDFDKLRAHGPAGQVFRRFGRTGHQTLHHAVGNPHRDAYLARRREEEAVRDAEQREEQRRKAERDARRPRCTSCQNTFSDDRWEAVENTPADPHPTLCVACAWRASDAEQTARRQAEQERLRQEAAAEEEAQGRRFFRRRSSSERQ
ncbi:ATP-binding protein [Streptomyces sp. NPDC051561]|uniref:ATP-binding protein n=1 Tax=Streptomyces sp. NPDC051561 TaxID=3365658 RepID=UPI0037BBB989